ncbi:MAG: 16S rRNA (cytosine(967)-C(5))-methyltransferase RsmB [Clostridia bacterium]|nr:16S rRNA (cytosine(967)-C(5))-methyltransferase RsmB [Clostridia bacterium]
MTDNARIAAYKAFLRINDGAFSNLISDFSKLSDIDRAFAEAIAIGTLERKITLEFVLSSRIKSDTKNNLKALLMTGLYQILYMDRVPDSAACDESVNIAKLLFDKSTAGFVNAVLRGICRDKDAIYKEIGSSEPYIRFSASKELYSLLNSQYGDKTEEIFNAFFGKSNTALRVNTMLATSEEIANEIDGTAISDTAIVCENAKKALKLIESGRFFVQGLASQKAVALLGAESGHTVIDVCACPGGKTLGAAIDMKNKGRIYSFDLHKNKLPLIEKSAKRLGIDIITTEAHDARQERPELIGIADRVICDVPCSGTGVMGSKPEIKYKSPQDFEGLYPTQRAILSNAAKYLKAGGIMVYSTCSINKLENEFVIKEFFASNKGYSLIYEETCLPCGSEREGFYMAKIKREF